MSALALDTMFQKPKEKLTEVMEIVRELNKLTKVEQAMLRVCAVKLLLAGKEDDLIPRSQFIDSGLSRDQVKRGSKLLIAHGYVEKIYSCGSCGAGLGRDYLHTAKHYDTCPMCGAKTAKNIWTRYKLSTWGRWIATHLVSMISYKDEIPLHPEAETYAHQAARVLSIGCQRQLFELKQYLRYVWDKHSELEWMLALSKAFEENRHRGGAAIYSLKGIITWGLRTIKEQKVDEDDYFQSLTPFEKQLQAKGRLTHYLDALKTSQNFEPQKAEKEYVILVGWVNELYKEFPEYVEMLDKLTIEAGYEPRLLRKPRPRVKEEPKPLNIKAYMAQFFLPLRTRVEMEYITA